MIPESSSGQSSSSNGILLANGSNNFSNPIYDFELSFEFASDCIVNDLTLVLGFGHTLQNPTIDFYNDGIIDWNMELPAFGSYGTQGNFWLGLGSSQDTIRPEKLIEIDATTGKVTDGFILLPKNAEIAHFDVDFTQNSIYSSLDSTQGFELNLTTGLTSTNLGYFNYQTEFSLLEETTASRLYPSVTNLISDSSTPVFYTDAYGMDWVRIAFEITNQTLMMVLAYF